MPAEQQVRKLNLPSKPLAVRHGCVQLKPYVYKNRDCYELHELEGQKVRIAADVECQGRAWAYTLEGRYIGELRATDRMAWNATAVSTKAAMSDERKHRKQVAKTFNLPPRPSYDTATLAAMKADETGERERRELGEAEPPETYRLVGTDDGYVAGPQASYDDGQPSMRMHRADDRPAEPDVLSTLSAAYRARREADHDAEPEPNGLMQLYKYTSADDEEHGKLPHPDDLDWSHLDDVGDDDKLPDDGTCPNCGYSECAGARGGRCDDVSDDEEDAV
jgi:hypothetical protein